LSEFELADVIASSVEMVVSKAEDTEVSVRAELGDDLGLIKADERRIRQVLFNLFSNGLRFTEPGGEVVVSADRIDDMARIVVRDTGRGINIEDQVSSFDSFTSSDQRGAGLGLALVKHFVELHGGRVAMKSESGVGTEVICWLPVKAVEHATAQDILFAESVAA
ncbi:MAG: ATP-binding protein, partial [Pseudomonadota bacterium]